MNEQAKCSVYVQESIIQSVKEGQAYGYRGGSKGGINWEIGVDIYTLLYMKSEKAMAPHSSTLA